MVSLASNDRFRRPCKDRTDGCETFPAGVDQNLLDVILAHLGADQMQWQQIAAGALAGPQDEQTNTAIIACLVFQFSYLDETVTCDAAKRFLPWQTDEGLKITIQTPITAHIADCRDCRNDMDTIRQLNLTREQLTFLCALFVRRSPKKLDTSTNSFLPKQQPDGPDHGPARQKQAVPAGNRFSNCSETQRAIDSIAKMNFSTINADILKHVCTCPNCRQLLYNHRKAMRNNLPEYDSSPAFPCRSVLPADIFDYCMPFGLDPDNDQYAQFRPSLTSHLLKCPTCLDKILKLHNTIYTILDRPDSDIDS